MRTVVFATLLTLARAVAPVMAQAPGTPAPEAALERLKLLEDSVRSQRYQHDMLLKRIDDLEWRFQLGDLAEIRKVRYGSAVRYQPNPHAQNAGNALVVYAYTFVPKSLDRSKKYPLLVLPHGGVRSNFSTAYSTIVRELIQQVYVVVAPEYRGGTGYGADFMEQIDYGGREIEDVYLGGRWVVENYRFVDRERVGILGWSHGGFLTLWNIFNHPEAYKVAFAGVPVSNLALRAGTKARGARGYPVDDYGAPSGIGASAYDNVQEYVKRSPAYNTEKLQTPLLVHTATNDSDVNVFEVQQLIDSFKARGKKFEYKIFQDPPGEHGFELLDTAVAQAARAEIYRFLATYLSPPYSPAR